MSCDARVTKSLTVSLSSAFLFQGWGAFCQSIMSKRDQEAFAEAEEYLVNLSVNQYDGGTTKSVALLFLYGDT